MSDYKCKRCGRLTYNFWDIKAKNGNSTSKKGFCKMCSLSELAKKGKKKK